jgi:hypothetical protein
MVSQTFVRVPPAPIDERFTTTAKTWNAAMSRARADPAAQSYGYVVALLGEQFKLVTTIRALLQMFAAPDVALLRRVEGLCALSGVELDPQVILGAACAQRLRQLQDGACL